MYMCVYMYTAVQRGWKKSKSFEDSHLKPRPGPGLDCLKCAESARQDRATTPQAWTNPLNLKAWACVQRDRCEPAPFAC